MRIGPRYQSRALDLADQGHDGRRGDGRWVPQRRRQDGRRACDDPRRLGGREREGAGGWATQKTGHNVSVRSPTCERARARTIDRERGGRTKRAFRRGDRGIVRSYSGTPVPGAGPPPTTPPPHVHDDVILTRLDIGVPVGPVEDGELHQLHFLQVVLALRLQPDRSRTTPSAVSAPSRHS